MGTSTTLGVKVEQELRERLQSAALRLACTPHALHKRALMSVLDRVDRGEIRRLEDIGQSESQGNGIDLTSSAGVFADLYREVRPETVLRSAITAAYRRAEPECLPLLLSMAQSPDPQEVSQTALALVKSIRAKHKTSPVEALTQAFSLSTQEGVALMCLAEALLRIPDQATRDALIRDKVAKGDWRSHVGDSSSIFVNAATWGLLLTGKLVALNSENSLSNALTRLIGKGGEPVIRRGVDLAMRMLGEQFVSGESIAQALAHASKLEKQGFRYSFDMLGEAAMTAADASLYFEQYEQAIHAIGKASKRRGIYEGNGISIKLSALHPRYQRAKRTRVMDELYPDLLTLVELARGYDIGINIDAEEADRLDISLDILERLCFEPSLAGWDGIGFVVQAYQKRALPVIDYLIDLARRSDRRMMVRLVKGAYWDSEIKRAQVDGLDDYPVFTRKMYSDVSYLACARRLLSVPDAVFPQFATHNAQTVASVMMLAGKNYYRGQYEFQCLHGMGEPLYEEVVKPLESGGLNRPCRIYAPVGTHETLLPYLVRRLLENGANSSFVNQIHDDKIDGQSLVEDPVQLASAVEPLGSPHPRIASPLDLYRQKSPEGRLASRGIDLSNESRLASLAVGLLSSTQTSWQARPVVAGHSSDNDQQPFSRSVQNPADLRDVVGHVWDAGATDVQIAAEQAERHRDVWHSTPVAERVAVLNRAADLFEAQQQTLIGIIVREAGKTLATAIGEVREAVDFLRYYGQEALRLCEDDPRCQPLGVVACISPWNFPLAIFTGQIAAALVAGNVVLAKPAEQTSLVAAEAVRLLVQAGVPSGVLQCLPGFGEVVGQALVSHPSVDAVMFTGSTDTAKLIERQLSNRLNRHGKPVTLIAETGGLNALVVDSSALPEQVVADVLASAFDSAGQRCSALRILLLQQDTADHVLQMLKGAMQELTVGNPAKLSTDVGPVIDSEAMAVITIYIQSARSQGRVIHQSPMPDDAALGTFVAPTLIELDDISQVEKEIFGPVLHVVRYERKDLDSLLKKINAKGFGLTFGVHTRIDEMSNHCIQAIEAGNIYVNRNIIGASVGVQPFGGQGLSGTGPKAGGPLYLKSLIAPTSAADLPYWVQEQTAWPRQTELVGPTGESNIYQLQPRGQVLCLYDTLDGLRSMVQALNTTGNRMLLSGDDQSEHRQALDAVSESIELVMAGRDLSLANFDAVLFEGDADRLLSVLQMISSRDGAIVPVFSMRTEQIRAGQVWPIHRLVHEKSICINTAAAGGNASLMMLT